MVDKAKIRIQLLNHGVGDSVTHPQQIDAEVKWGDGEEPKWDNLKFTMHTTPLKEINWSIRKESSHRKNFIGYCRECGVIFFVRNEPMGHNGLYPMWEEELFKKVFNSNGEFRELILKEATDV